ncbi:MAG: hypothetical protein ACOX4S_00975 [Anaerovoracaceae bacterium]|jgi:hypothetical protein
MLNIDTFVIKNDLLEGKDRFAIRRNFGVEADVADSELLMDHENTDGVFSLDEQHKKVSLSPTQLVGY